MGLSVSSRQVTIACGITAIIMGITGLIIALECIDHALTNGTPLNPAIMTAILVIIALLIITAVVIILSGRIGKPIDEINTSLSESEEKFRTLFENDGDAIFLMDGPVIVDCNTRALQVYRRSRQELIGHTPADFSPELQPDGFLSEDKMVEIVDQALKGTPRFFEWTHFYPDGELFTAEVTVNSISMHDPSRLLVISRDITDRRKSEELLKSKNFELQAAYEQVAASEEELRAQMDELREREEQVRESDEKFRTLFDLAPFACTVISPDRRYVLVNKFMEKAIGFPLSDILGKRTDELGMMPPGEQARLAEKMRSQGYIRDEEVTIVTRQGEERTLLNSSTVIMLQGEPYILSTMMDITDRRRMEEELRRSNDQVTGIAETIPGVVFQFYARNSGETGLYYVSRRGPEIFGVQGDLSSLMQVLISGIVPEDRTRFLQSIDQAVKEESRWEYEGRFVKPSAELLYFRGIAAPVRSGDELVFSGVLLDITRQKEAESALVKSEQAYREIFNNSIVGIFRATVSGGFIDLNPALARMYGFDSPEEMKRYLTDFDNDLYVTPADWETIQDILARDGELRNYECEHRKKDGNHIWVSINGKQIRDDTGTLLYDEGTVEDITSRKLAETELAHKQGELQAAYELLAGSEEELKQQLFEIREAHNEIEKRERKFRQLFEANIAGIVLHEIICDESGVPYDYRYLEANSAFEQITGQHSADIIGKTIRELKPDVDPAWIEKYGRIALTGETLHFESYDINKELYYDVSVYSPGKGQFATVFLDITARKLAEDAISEKNAYLENLITNALGPIMVWDPGFIITRINESCEHLLGKSSGSIIGHPLGDLLPAHQAETLMQMFHQSPDPRIRDIIELEMMHQDGSIRTVVWSMSTIMDPDGERPLATIAQGWDVTTERILEKERIMAMERINENIAKLAILNDGIRNPLSIMACFIDLIEDPDIRTKIGDEIVRIDQMVTNLDKEWVTSDKILNYLKKHDHLS